MHASSTNCAVRQGLALGALAVFSVCGVGYDAVAEPTAAANTYLRGRLGAIRAKNMVPALSAALVMDGRTVAVGVVGTRRQKRIVLGTPKKENSLNARLNDRFHLGSVTKVLTGFLVAVLVEKGRMRWDMTIKEVFPELAKEETGSRSEYFDVTVAQLLAHESGMRVQPLTEPGDEWAGQPLTKRRLEYVTAALKDAPQTPSPYGGGSIIVAAMAERITGVPWETLMQTYVYEPLGMTTAGAGPISPMWEHSIAGTRVVPRTPPAGYASEPHAPAGRNVHASIGDLAKFLAANLTYAKDRPNVVSQGALSQMHMALGPGPDRYSQGGWVRIPSPWEGKYPVLEKNGFNGYNWADAWVSPWENVAFAAMTNVDAPRGSAAVNNMKAELIALWQNWSSIGDLSDSYARGKPTTASNVFNGLVEFDASKATDSVFTTRWATNGSVKTAWLEVDLGAIYNNIGRIVVSEEYAPRVNSFKIEYKSAAGAPWKTAASGTAMGRTKKLSFNPVSARWVRLNITDSSGGPTISEFMVLPQFSSTLQ